MVLPQPDSPDEAEHLVGSYPEIHSVHGGEAARSCAILPEAHRNAPQLEQVHAGPARVGTAASNARL